jgi:hypothetical protein
MAKKTGNPWFPGVAVVLLFLLGEGKDWSIDPI